MTYRYELTKDTENAWVQAFDGEKTVGLATVILGSDDAYVERMDVDAEYQNQGIGTEMLRTARELAAVVYAAPDSEDSKRLYARIGCEMRKDRYDEYGFAIDQGFGVYEI